MLEIVKQIQPKKELKIDNSFPYSVFPDVIYNYIEEMEIALGYPKDYTAAAVLFSLSIAIGNTRKIELKRDFTAGANVFLITIGRPGANKSRPFKKTLQYISSLDYENYVQYKKELALYDTEQSKPSNERDELTKPVCINYLLQDLTPEVLPIQLSINSRGLGVFVDEILGWLKNINGFSSRSSEEMYLSLWSGLDLKVNRVSKEQLIVKDPFVSIAGTIQPMKLKNAFKGKEENGLTDRILFVFPDEIKANEWTDTNIDLSMHEEWSMLLQDVFRKLDCDHDKFGIKIPRLVKMTAEAREYIINWQNNHEKKLINDDEEAQSIGAKMQDYLLRFCLILHVAEWVTGGCEEFTMNKQTAEKAVKLVEYFTNQAFKVRDFIYNNTDDKMSALSGEKRDLFHELEDTFPIAEGIELAKKKGISKATAERFFSSDKYFIKIKRGVYQKI